MRITSLITPACISLLVACSLKPGSIKRLENKGIKIENNDLVVKSKSAHASGVKAVYLGCGGIYLEREGQGLLIDPFFSNVRFNKIGKSVFLNRKNIRSNPEMIELGLNAIQKVRTSPGSDIKAILNAHSHYDHLMDVPALYEKFNKRPLVLLGESGFNICHAFLDTSRVFLLEKYMSTNKSAGNPVRIETDGKETIRIYPILSDHNPHFRHIKFFSGSQTKKVADYLDPYQKTPANLWLEGRTFSFLIDFLNSAGEITYRVFIQSSSCNAPAGIPPEALLKRKVDLAFLGVVSYGFSPGYPCEILHALQPSDIVWVHWEDFFRKYSKQPKTVRGTDIPGFFDIPCVKEYPVKGKMLAPRVKIEFVD